MNIKSYGSDSGDSQDAETYVRERYRLTDSMLRRAFVAALAEDAPKETLALALRLFVGTEP